MTPIPWEKKNNAINFILSGLSTRKIADRLKISRGSISNFRREISEELPEVKNGRPAKLSDQVKRSCVHLINSREAKTPTGVSKILRRDHNITVSRQTVGRSLNEMGMKSAEKEENPAVRFSWNLTPIADG